MPQGVYPFTKNHRKGERLTRSAVCTSSPLRSLRPRWTTVLNTLQHFIIPGIPATKISENVL